MATTVDTLQIARSLAGAGMDRGHAEAIAEQFRGVVDAGRGDLVTRDHLDTKLLEVRSDLGMKISELRGEMKDMRAQILWSMLGMQVALLGTLVLLANFTALLR